MHQLPTIETVVADYAATVADEFDETVNTDVFVTDNDVDRVVCAIARDVTVEYDRDTLDILMALHRLMEVSP